MTLEHYPYPSRRMPIVASRGVVATSEPLAAQAGLAMLQQGGNAVDAALATAIALTVIEPDLERDRFRLVRDRLGRQQTSTGSTPPGARR